jgi:hypothetical protein
MRFYGSSKRVVIEESPVESHRATEDVRTNAVKDFCQQVTLRRTASL